MPEQPRFVDERVSHEFRYSLGIDTKLGGYYLSIPVSNGVVDYEEYYLLTPNRYAAMISDAALAIEFAEACRQHEHDDLLLQKPGWNRGTPV